MMEKTCNRTKKVIDIWNDSWRIAEDKFQTGDIQRIMEICNVGEDDAKWIDHLCGAPEQQIAYINAIGAHVKFVLECIKTHERKEFVMSSVGEWDRLNREMGNEPAPTDADFYDAYHLMRECPEMRGKYWITIEVENADEKG